MLHIETYTYMYTYIYINIYIALLWPNHCSLASHFPMDKVSNMIFFATCRLLLILHFNPYKKKTVLWSLLGTCVWGEAAGPCPLAVCYSSSSSSSSPPPPQLLLKLQEQGMEKWGETNHFNFNFQLSISRFWIVGWQTFFLSYFPFIFKYIKSFENWIVCN